MNFQVVKTFAKGEIHHIHFIKRDVYENCRWMNTGDYRECNKECRLYRSKDNGDYWGLIGQGSQNWRAIGICFKQKELILGADVSSCLDTVHFIRMDRNTHQIEVAQDFEDLWYGCASYKDDRIFFSTGVEEARMRKIGSLD